VMLPPGRAKLSTKPAPTGSGVPTNTIGTEAIDVLKAACPSDLPSTPTGRIEAMHVRLSAMLEGVRTVRAPLAKLYELLNDEQKARLNSLQSGEDQNEPERRRNLSVLCSERASGISTVPIRRIELAVRPDEVRVDAMLRAINIVQPALQKFYGSLTG
jgi:hypothetical protein